MEEQVKKLQIIVDHLSKKSQQPNSKILMECYEVFSECILIVQREINLEIGNVMDKLFMIIREMVENSQLKIQPTEPQQIVVATKIPEFVNALQLGSVSVLDQLGNGEQVKNIHQIPWCDYKCKEQKPRNFKGFQDVGTSTVIDYYENCQKSSSQFLKNEEEIKEWIEYTNDTIAMLGEAIANKKQLDIEYQGKPGDVDLLISDIHFRRLNLEQVLRSVNPDNFGVQNYDNTVQFLQQHIHQIQQQTAIAVIQRMKHRQEEKDKQQQIINEMKGKIKKKVMHKEDCRCAQYVNDILSLKNKLEQIQTDLAKKEHYIMELEIKNDQKDIQYRMLQQQFYQMESDRMEMKSKLDNYVRLAKKNSDRGYISQSSNDEIVVNGITAHPRTTSRDQSQQQSSKQQILLTPKENYIIQKKTQQMERLVKLVNALDVNNQTRRLTQMQFILEQKATSQINDLADLIKDIEENDLLQNDAIDNSTVTKEIEPISSRFLEKQSKQFTTQRNSLQNSFEIEMNMDKPTIKVSIPAEQITYQRQVPSNRIMSSVGGSQKKQDLSNTNYNQRQMDTLKIKNSSSNQLSPNQSNGRMKSSQNMSLHRQSSIKQQQQQQQQQSTQTITDKSKKQANSKNIKDQYQQTDHLHKIDISTQTEKVLNKQTTEQIDNIRIMGSYNKNNSQQLTTSSTFHFNSLGTSGNIVTPIQSASNSNIQSPRNQISQHHPNSTITGSFPLPSPSPASALIKNKLQSVKSESENSQLLGRQLSLHTLDNQQSKQSQSLKQRILERQEEKHQKSNHRKMYTSTATQFQSLTPRENTSFKIKSNDDLRLQQFQQNQEDEQLMSDQVLHDLPEQHEHEIIQKAINRTPGYELASELTENILLTMFDNLQNVPEFIELIKKLNKSNSVTFTEFKRFVNRIQAFHKKCGRECNHLQRFYLRLGFVSTKYLNKRKQLILQKPKVLPGFK
ncbi:unnamed protein product [Paramecium octaurelia]|uniref:Uncharacterized protein n=1 Tax=Paramecium octaurelia TaxID=43137 RepID=A0A8S1XKN2_PAROT|nr:unnamed protein product [Paramecium octaurelia]